MELKKTNVISPILVVFISIFIISCSSEKGESSKKETSNKNEVSLNTFETSTLLLKTKFDSLTPGESNFYSSNLGKVATQSFTLLKENQKTLVNYTSYDSLITDYSISDLFYGRLFKEFGEDFSPEIQSTTDSSLFCYVNDSLIYDFRKGSNYTILLQYKNTMEIDLLDISFNRN